MPSSVSINFSLTASGISMQIPLVVNENSTPMLQVSDNFVINVMPVITDTMVEDCRAFG
jgi:hypothetical protein